jgi:hypothetical protein
MWPHALHVNHCWKLPGLVSGSDWISALSQRGQWVWVRSGNLSDLGSVTVIAREMSMLHRR